MTTEPCPYCRGSRLLARSRTDTVISRPCAAFDAPSYRARGYSVTRCELCDGEGVIPCEAAYIFLATLRAESERLMRIIFG